MDKSTGVQGKSIFYTQLHIKSLYFTLQLAVWPSGNVIHHINKITSIDAKPS